MAQKSNWKRDITLLTVPLIFLIIFYLLPLAEIARVTISRFNLDEFGKAINWQVVFSALSFTFYQAILSTILTIGIGLPAAWLFGRFKFRGKNALRIASTLPFILPTVVVAAGFSALIGPRGWINIFLMQLMGLKDPPISILNSLSAILLAHVFYNTSIMIRVVGAALSQFDQRLEDAAQTLGASSWQAFLKVTLPNLLPSILSAVLLVFLFDFTSFGVVLMLGGPQFSTLEVEIYIQTVQFLNLPLAGILSLIQLFFTMLVTLALIRIGDSGFAVPIMPRMQEENMRSPRRVWEKAFAIGIIAILLLLLVSPVAALVFKSLLIEGSQGQEISIKYFLELFSNRRQSYFYVPPFQALLNSLRFALISSLVSLFLGMLLSYGLRVNSRFNRWVEWLIMFPLGTSAVTLGLGFFIFFFRGTGSARWYPWLIPMVHSLISLPFVLRVVQPVLRSIPANIHWAAATLGASPPSIFRRVDLPILWRSLMTAALYAFTISLGEFGATSFLSRPDLPTMPIAIFRYLGLPGSINYGQAMAMAVIILLVCVISMLSLDQLQYLSFRDKA
ncbi:MAG: iron ABC transporter permease [Chloroflexi bacterium]|nr:iron ABC transporter permease [Chloroflexota bacterium]